MVLYVSKHLNLRLPRTNSFMSCEDRSPSASPSRGGARSPSPRPSIGADMRSSVGDVNSPPSSPTGVAPATPEDSPKQTHREELRYAKTDHIMRRAPKPSSEDSVARSSPEECIPETYLDRHKVSNACEDPPFHADFVESVQVWLPNSTS